MTQVHNQQFGSIKIMAIIIALGIPTLIVIGVIGLATYFLIIQTIKDKN